jgi:hypothetical protein
MKHTLEVHLWGFQGQTVDYSPGIWGSNVLSKSSFQGRLPHDNRNYKEVIPKGLSWRFDSSESECAITCFQLIPLKDRPADFFAGTVVFPRGTIITEEQLQELQQKVSTAIEVLGRIVTKMRPDEMGPLGGELRTVEDKERLERPHEICVIPHDSRFTLGGLVRKLVELRHNQLTVFIVEPQNGQAAGQAELKAIEAVAQKSHPEAPVVLASDFDGLQIADDQRYQELLDYRAEQKRIAEEKEQARLAREAEEEKRRQEQERQRKRRQAQLLEYMKKAAKGLGVLAVVAGLGYGGYLIKDEVLDLFQSTKTQVAGWFDSGKKSPRTLDDIRPAIGIRGHRDTTIVNEIFWSSEPKILRQSFQFDENYRVDSLSFIALENRPSGVEFFVHESDSTLHGMAIEFDGVANDLGLTDTLRFSALEFPGLPVSELVVILQKKTEANIEQGSLSVEGDSTSVDTSTTPEVAP